MLDISLPDWHTMLRRRFSDSEVRSILGRVAVTALFASLLVGIPAAAANAKTVYPSLTWTQYGTTAKVNGNANVDFFQCGLLVCTDTDTVYGRVGRTAGTVNNQARVKLSTTLDGIAANVAVSTSSAGASFALSSKSCSTGFFTGLVNVTYTSVSFGTQEICYANSAVYLAAPTYSVTGGVRVGSSWSARTATAS